MLKEIKILTIFPKFFDQFSQYGVVGKAIREQKISFDAFDIRSHGIGNNNSVDDSPYGGGAGMVWSPDHLLINVIHLKQITNHIPIVL